MPIKEVKIMSWAEFTLRSFAFWEERERELMLQAKMDYKLYCLNFMYSKKKPDSFKVFAKKEYGLELKGKEVSRVSEAAKKRFLEAQREYQRQKDGRVKR